MTAPSPALSWIKLFTNFWHHQKRKALRPRDRNGRIKPCCATCLHVDALAFAGQSSSRGIITLDEALDTLYGTPKFIEQLVAAGLWDPTLPGTWVIHDFDEVQATPEDLSAKRALAGRKGNCRKKKHPEDCRCWDIEDPS